MTKRKLLSILIVGTLLMTMVFGVVGCKTADTDSTQPETEDISEEGTSEEIPTIKMTTLCFTTPTDTEMVAEAISEITREKIGVNIELIPVEIGNWSSVMSLMLSSGDNQVDVYIGGYWSTLGAIVSNGQAIALDDYIDEYAPNLEEALTTEVFNCGTIDGEHYGIARYLDFGTGVVYNLRKDIADEYGVSNGDSMTLDELTELFRTISADYPDTPLAGSTSTGLNAGGGVLESSVDKLGDSNYLGVLIGDSTTVVNYYESDEYLQMVEYFKQWREIGVYMSDPLNNTEAAMDYLVSGKCLGNFASHFDAELNGIWATENYGTEMISISVMEAVAQTPGMYFCVAPDCQYPEKAVAWIDLMASDSEIANLLANGIEGVHYSVDDEGTAHYAEGVDASNAGWTLGLSWTTLNSTISYPFEYPATYYEKMVASNNDSEKSAGFGFEFDATNVANELAACTNVCSQYRAAIECAATDNMDDMVVTFQQALKDAGIDAIIAEKQAQLDEFIASNE